MKRIPIPGGCLALHSEGKGDPLLFLHGGPGDTHHYMRRMSAPLQAKFQCINFDQRGVGQSFLEEISEASLSLENFFQDIQRIQDHLGVQKISLVGHSWGAMLALYFANSFPQLVEKLALVSMGPVTENAEKVCTQRLMSHFSEAEKTRWTQLRSERQRALESNNKPLVESLDKKLMELRVKSWVFHPEKRNSFLEEYFQDPPPNREVNQLVFQGSRGHFSWNDLKFSGPLWVCYGENDFAPVNQAEEFQRLLPHAKLTLIPNCGHIPWLDQEEIFYRELLAFLTEG